MLKKSGCIILAMLLVLSLLAGGCSSQSDSTDPSTTPDSSTALVGDVEDITQKIPEGGTFEVSKSVIGNTNAEIVLTWQPVPDHSFNSNVEACAEDITKKIEAWVKKYPNVKVVPMEAINSTTEMMAKLQLNVADGTIADVAAVDSFIVANVAEYGVSLNPYLEQWGIAADDFFPYVQEAVTVDGEMKALWYNTDLRGLFYRKDWIETPPTTMDEVLAIGKEMADQGRVGLSFNGGRGEGTANNFWGLYWCQGGEIIDENGELGFAEGANRQAVINVLSYMKRAVDEGISPASVIEYTTDTMQHGEMANGNVAMAIANSRGVYQLRDIMGEEEFNSVWGFAPYPVIEAGQQSTCSAGGWTYMIFTDDKLKQDLAADLIYNLYVSDEASESFCRVNGFLPTRKSLFDKFSFLKEDPYLVTCGEILTTANTRPGSPLYSTISAEIQVAVGEVISGSASPEEATDPAIANIKNNS